MKKEPWRGQNSARFLYFYYKDSPYYSWLFLSIIFSVSIILIFNVIIPQAQGWFSIRDEVLATRQRIAILNSNITFMSNLNKDQIDLRNQLALKALPLEKNFSDVIDAIVGSSIRSNVTVDDFDFSLGQIASFSAKDKKGLQGEIDSVKVQLSLRGSIDGVKNFVKEMSDTFPLSEVDSVDTTSGETAIEIKFYTKDFKDFKIVYDQPVQPISAANSDVLNSLEKKSVVKTKSIPVKSDSIPIF